MRVSIIVVLNQKMTKTNFKEITIIDLLVFLKLKTIKTNLDIKIETKIKKPMDFQMKVQPPLKQE